MSYHVGDVARLQVTITISGVNSDPTDITCRIKSPTASTETVTYPGQIVKDAVGVYHYDLLLTSVGDWYFTWLSTGAASASAPGRLFCDSVVA